MYARQNLEIVVKYRFCRNLGYIVSSLPDYE